METAATQNGSRHIASVSPAAGIHTDNMPSGPTEKAKIPLPEKREKKKEKKKAYALSLTYLPIFFYKKKTSPVHHKLSTTRQASSAAWGGEQSEIQHAFTGSTDLV